MSNACFDVRKVYVLIEQEIDTPSEIIGVFVSRDSAEREKKAKIDARYPGVVAWMQREVDAGSMHINDGRSIEEHAHEWIDEYRIAECEVKP